MKTSSKAGAAGAGAILLAVSFIQPWEGLWTTAKVDTIGTGHPITYCYGQTNENGTVKVGQHFTPQQCSDLLAKTLPKYWDEISPCIHVAIPDKVEAALISGAYNAGSAAMCRSPMIAKINAGDILGGCQAFKGWYIRADGKVVKGLINRRTGERALCLDGTKEQPNLTKRAPPVAPPAPVSFWTKLYNAIFKRG
jgi:lysozyme